MVLKLPRISTDQRVALLYAAFGGLWIALSDRILATLARDVAALTIMQTYKGWAFVVISAALIYSLLRRDLALRNRAENTLRASERRYQTLANISPVGIFRSDPDGATTYVNPMWSEITGLLQDKALGDGWLAAVHPDDQEKLRRDWQESTAQQKPSFSDYRFVRSDGTMAWVMGQATPEIAADGQITGYVGTITDITERKQHEEAVRRRAEEFAALYEVGRETTAQTDLPRLLETITQQSARLLKASDATIYLYDAAKDELELAAANVYALPRGSRFPVSQGISGAVIRERQAKIVDDYRTWSSRRPELQHVDLRAVALVPLIHREEIIGVLAVAEIGNDRKYTAADTRLLELLASQAASAIQNARLRAELETYNRELEARVAQRTEELSDALLQAQDADRLKSVFLATMSHELRTPLNSIIGFSGILLQGLAGPLNAEQSKQLGMVRDSARHLLALINDVLDISKIEAGQLRVERAPFAMRSVIESAVRAVSPLAQKKGLVLHQVIAAEVGDISSDRRRVEQILLNLLSNAIKFTEQGGVRLECRVQGKWLDTSVSDSGMGIRPEDLGRLFEPFHQLETGLNRRHEGTGLGLAICKNLMRLLGGEIHVESEWGEGSVFTFMLPLDA